MWKCPVTANVCGVSENVWLLSEWEIQAWGVTVMCKHLSLTEKEPIGAKQWEAEVSIGNKIFGFEIVVYMYDLIVGSPGK